MEDYDDNIFDEDDALDYILYQEAEGEAEGEVKQPKATTGCFGLLLVLMIPVGMILKYY